MSLKRVGRFLLDLLLIAAGSVLMALAVDVFLDPNDVVPGGFTALAMFANQADPQAFMVINPSHEVLGEGFKPLLHPRPR